MKTFLIATDFSPASRNAMQYGIELARAFNGRVVLTSAYEQVPVTVAEPLVLVAPDMGAIVTQKLEAEADHLNIEKATPVEILAKEGQASHAILKAAAEVHADLIIAGMKGSGKATRKLLGSTVTSLARKSSVPLAVIPEEASYKSPGTIALANDISMQADTHLLDTLRSLVEKFQSKLYIIRVITKQSDEVVEVLNRPSNLSKMVGKLEPLYEYPLDKNITRALNDFISTHHVDMLAMIPHKEVLPERWFLRSNTREMLFKTTIPLLILPEAPHKQHTHSIIF
ncbi:universal stress protein [Flavitalea sp. BT771]|uniref:universal stress protein n=1 Tax=Flavitalea sp. BT771 TaxID=3063329 RepID=UPI0026E12F14|nr:universal stress protein [Flavitalea sp. BT771]MDO6430351.1 universal stress protein [Flavitalea sp. BT771]MDV6219509.1 universal stress protein [Flavitalea sp. BT771]